MSRVFEDDSDPDIEINTKNEYAKNYDIWRRKEEFNKLKTKYGEELLEEDSTSSDDDEEGVELTEEIEKQFFKTLSCLKNKDPRIYDENVNFFEDLEYKQVKIQKTKKKKPLYINDYEREMILKTNGKFSDSEEEEENSRSLSPTYVEEQKKIKDSLKQVLNEVSDDENGGDGEWGGILKVRHKTEEEKQKEEAEYMKWLAGQKDQIDDKEAEAELKPLKDYWNNPNLDDGEKFLRDYILQKKFLSKEDDDYIPTYEEIVHDSDNDLSDDENAIETQQEFEHKYNFRFEEPDQEFIKRYPRTMEQSLRRTDDKRKLKRVETKERKQKEKEQKMQELKKLQEFKRKEIEERIQQLKEITGNDDIEFKDEDLEGDFDPEAHDKKMQSLFNDEFYEGPEENEKPVFPEIDDYLEIENWQQWQGENGEEAQENEDNAQHCEDEDFNMDCDYDPQAAVKEELSENSKGRKKRKRKSLFAKAVSQPKPVFDPNDKTYEEYLDEYYKLDCEDIIGDMPCRFKYRKVVPNDFGLTTEEILMAKDRELNKWCSLKKATQHRPEQVEKYDQIAYGKKAKNIELKKRILPSLFESEKNKEEKIEVNGQIAAKSKKKVKKIRCKRGVVGEENSEESKNCEQQEENSQNGQIDKKKNKKQKELEASGSTENPKVVNTNSDNGSENKQNKKKRKKKKNKNEQSNNSAESSKQETKINKKRKLSTSNNENVPRKKSKVFKQKKSAVAISDARLTAYGINPKKYKNKLKYGNS